MAQLSALCRPEGTGKSKEARWIDIYESDALNEAQLSEWIRQSAELPGWEMG